MQPSTWNDTNQHWVPQFLLKGFGIKKKASQIWELDKRTGTTAKRKVKDVASKQGLLSDRDDELMRKLEIEATRAISRIRKVDLNISLRDRISIDRLVAAMIQNDPYNGFDEGKARQEAIDSVSKSVKEAVALEGGFFEPGTLESYMDERISHDYLALTLGGENYVVPSMLHHMRLQAIFAPEGDGFIIGDSPVLVVRSSEGAAGPNLRNPGSQVILPISTQCILFYDWATAPNLIAHGGTVDGRQLLSLNQDYSHESNCRFLYGRTEESLTQSRRPLVNWGNAQRSTGVGQGWFAFQQYFGSVEAKNAEEEKLNAEGLRLEARKLVQQAARQNQGSG